MLSCSDFESETASKSGMSDSDVAIMLVSCAPDLGGAKGKNQEHSLHNAQQRGNELHLGAPRAVGRIIMLS